MAFHRLSVCLNQTQVLFGSGAFRAEIGTSLLYRGRLNDSSTAPRNARWFAALPSGFILCGTQQDLSDDLSRDAPGRDLRIALLPEKDSADEPFGSGAGDEAI